MHSKNKILLKDKIKMAFHHPDGAIITFCMHTGTHAYTQMPFLKKEKKTVITLNTPLLIIYFFA